MVDPGEEPKTNIGSIVVEKLNPSLTNRLVSAPVLTLPSGFRGYVMYCDALKHNLGCTLMQQGEVIAYSSKQLKSY